MKARTVHYAGKMKIVGSKSVKLLLPGWAACCSGDRAEKIAADRANTRDKAKVTCAKCLKAIAAELDGFAKYPESFATPSHWNVGYTIWKSSQRKPIHAEA